LRILNGRDWPVPPRKIPGLTRIAVLGDSLAYGQGVDPSQTLPFVLENELNAHAIEPLFHVVNCGVSGFNIWNSLTTLQNLPHFFDAVVIVLCSNDTEVFGRTWRIQYDQAQSAVMWEPGTASFELMRRELARAAEMLAARDVPLMVVYYSIWDTEAEARRTEVIRNVCRDLNCPFVAFLDHFRARRLDPKLLFVSKYDHHPSAIAHATAAPYLLQQFRQHGWLGRMKSTRAAYTLPVDLLEVAHAMEREGAPLDSVLRWAIDALNAKLRRALRETDNPESDQFIVGAKKILALLHQTYARWHALSRAQALPGNLWLAQEAILRAEELMAAAALPDEEAVKSLKARLPDSNALPPSTDLVPTTEEIEGARERTARLQAMVETVTSTKGGTSFQGLAAMRREAARSVVALAGLNEMLGEQSRICLQHGDELERKLGDCADCARDLLGRAKVALSDAWTHLSACWHAYDYVFERAPAVPEFLTTVTVHVRTFERANVSPPMLDAIVESLAPHRPVTKDGMNIGCDGNAISVTMRFPRFFYGRVSLRIDQPKPELRRRRGTFVKMEIYNDPLRRVILERDQMYHTPYGDLSFPYVLVP
jgi:GDSL-like Lipase/Acylhydrolase family